MRVFVEDKVLFYKGLGGEDEVVELLWFSV